MSGHTPDASARRQLNRLQTLVDQLASAKPSSTLPLVLSALASVLSIEQLCLHLSEERRLRLVASAGLPPPLVRAWASVPMGAEGGPMGVVAENGRVVVVEDIDRSDPWGRFAALGHGAGIRSSWSVPLIGASGLIGVITGCQPFVGRPQRDQMDLVSLYAGYAAGTIERDRLFGEVTARNRVLETIREVLETLAGPEQVSQGPGSSPAIAAPGAARHGDRAVVESVGWPSSLRGLRHRRQPGVLGTVAARRRRRHTRFFRPGTGL